MRVRSHTDCLTPLGLESEADLAHLQSAVGCLDKRLIELKKLSEEKCQDNPQRLKPSLDFLENQKAQAKKHQERVTKSLQEFKRFREKHQVKEEDLREQDENGIKIDKQIDTIGEFRLMSRHCSGVRKKRNLAFDTFLDRNHSHFIFADDGSLDSFGMETGLRADIESCIAGNFRSIGVASGGTSKRLLDKIDCDITAKLKVLKKGVCGGMYLCCLLLQDL